MSVFKSRLKQLMVSMQVVILCLFMLADQGQAVLSTGLSDAKKAYEWIFSQYDADEATIGPHKVRNTWAVPGGANQIWTNDKGYLDFTLATQDTTINLFHVTVEPNFGMQFSGQYAYFKFNGETDNGNTWPGGYDAIQCSDCLDMLFQVFFHTCITEQFVIVTFQNDGDADINFQIGIDGNGNYYYVYSTVNNESRQTNYVRTPLEVKHGWNYFAFAAEEVYEFTYVRAYNRYVGMDTVTDKSGWDDLDWWEDQGAYKHGKHYNILTGEHLAYWGGGEDVMVLGCMTTRNFNNYNDDSFGLCMQGWIQYISIYIAEQREGTISNVDSEADIESYHQDASGNFANTALKAVQPDLKDFGGLTALDTAILSWDSADPTQAEPYTYDPFTNAFYSTKFSCTISIIDKMAGTGWTPYWLQYQGRVTGNDTDYFQCQIDQLDLPASNVVNRLSLFGPQYTIETWFRLDPENLQIDGYTYTIFCVYDSTEDQCMIGVGGSNNFLRIWVNGKQQDIRYDFYKQRWQWHYVAVSYQRLHEMNTRVTVYLDGQEFVKLDWFEWWPYDPVAAAGGRYYFRIAYDFPGIVRKIKVNAQAFCAGASLPVVMDSSLCQQRGAYSCDFCDLEQEVANTDPQEYACFTTCRHFAEYANEFGECSHCHQSCRYCRNSNDYTDCYRCDPSRGFSYNPEKGITYYNSEDGNTHTCRCADTYFHEFGNCHECDYRCAVCNRHGNDDCPVCADGSFMTEPLLCETGCPPGKVEDPLTRSCLYPTVQAHPIKLPADPQGCFERFFWDWEKQKCEQCDSDCETCEFKKDRCMTCNGGKYLANDRDCKTCNSLFSNKVESIDGGVCMEECGDGKNFGVHVCDDGNNLDGDGCEHDCTLTKGWMCRNGYEDQGKDNCFYIPTELESVIVNQRNHLLLRFTRPVSPQNRAKTDKKDFSIYIQHRDTQEFIPETSGFRRLIAEQEGVVIKVPWNSVHFTHPCSYIYIETDIQDRIRTSYTYDNLLSLDILESTILIDENYYDVNTNIVNHKAMLFENDPFPQWQKDEAEYWARYTIMFMMIAIFLWGTYALLLRKTQWPALMIFMGFQLIFFAVCQDLHQDRQMTYYWGFYRFLRIEHARIPNFFFVFDYWVNWGMVDEKLYNTNLTYIAEYWYNFFYANNILKMYCWISFFILMPLVACLDLNCSQSTIKSGLWCREFVRKQLFSRYFFSTSLMFINLFFYPGMLTALLEISQWKYDNRYKALSFVFSWLVCTINIVFVASLWMVPLLHHTRYAHPLLRYRLKMFFAPMKPYFFSMLFAPVYTTRRLVHILFVVFFQEFSFVPNGLQLLISLTFLCYLIAVRPFRSGTASFTAIVMEVLYFLMQLYLLPFYTKAETYYKVAAKYYLFRLPIYFLFGLILIFAFIVWWRALDKFYYRRFKKKRNSWWHKVERWWRYKTTWGLAGKAPPMFAEAETKKGETIGGDKLDKLQNLDAKTTKSQNVLPARSLQDIQENPNVVRDRLKDDETYDDHWLYPDPWRDGFPEKEMKVKYLKRRPKEETQSKLHISKLGDVTKDVRYTTGLRDAKSKDQNKKEIKEENKQRLKEMKKAEEDNEKKIAKKIEEKKERAKEEKELKKLEKKLEKEADAELKKQQANGFKSTKTVAVVETEKEEDINIL